MVPVARFILWAIVISCLIVPLIFNRFRTYTIIILLGAFLFCFMGVITSGRLAISDQAPKLDEQSREAWISGAAKTNSIATDFMVVALLAFLSLTILALTPSRGALNSE
jgi:hypothetical protein